MIPPSPEHLVSWHELDWISEMSMSPGWIQPSWHAGKLWETKAGAWQLSLQQPCIMGANMAFAWWSIAAKAPPPHHCGAPSASS